MPKKLEKNINKPIVPQLENAKARLFKITFETSLTNGYEIKDMQDRDIKEFHRFIEDTIYKKLTISEVDRLFLRKEGLGNAPPVKYGDIELSHYGKAKKPFRLFGYYNTDGYFVICRIDGKHKTHKE